MKLIFLVLLLLSPLGAQNLTYYLDPSNGGLPVSQLTPLPSVYTFADTAVGGGATTIVRVVNGGSSPVTVTNFYIGATAGSITASNSFALSGYVPSSVIAPGFSKLFTISFNPRAQGQATGYLQANIGGAAKSITTLIGSGTPPQVTLSCTGTPTQCSGGVLQPTSTTAISFGSILTTSTISIPFTLKNGGTAVLNPQALVAITTATNNPNTPFGLTALPSSLAPGSSTNFNVTFAPGVAQTFQTTLMVGGNAYAIVGTGTSSVLGDISSLAITYTDYTGVRLTAQPGTALSFGQVVNGTTTGSNTLTFTVSNPQTTILAVPVTSIAATGVGFSVSNVPTLPASIAPGASIAFKLVFTPTQTGTYSGTLSIGTRQFPISAQAITSPVPDASFTVDVMPLVSSKQAHVSIALATVSPVSAIGTLTLQFTPSVSGVTDDPAVYFVATSGRQLQVNIASGGQVATYNGDSSITFQTGTTAGTLSFTLALPNKAPYTQSFTISPQSVQISTVTAVRQTPNLVVTMTGYDNTYSTGQMTFNFLDANGKTMTPNGVAVDASAKFHTYFSSSQVGGAFSVQVSFPIVGDVATVGSTSVAIANNIGSTTSTKQFQ